MLNKLRRKLLPVTLSRGLSIVLRVKRISANTKEQYRRSILSLREFMEADCLVQEVTEEHVTAWFNWLQQRENQKRPGRTISYTTAYYHARALRAYFNTLVDAGHLDKSPFRLRLRRPPAPDRVKSIPPADIEKLLRATTSIRDQALILALRDSGCRLNALVDMRADRLRFQQHEDGTHYAEADVLDDKIGERVWLHFQDRAARTLYAYSLTRPFNAGPEFWLNQLGRPLSSSGVRQVLKRLSKKAGVKRANPHSFRHAKVQRMLLAGAPHKAIQDTMGWKSAAMLQVYVQSTQEDVRRYNEQWDDFGSE